MRCPIGLRIPAWLSLLLLAACARGPVAPVEAPDPAPAPAPAPTYDTQTLADLLVAEVAAQRDVLGVTMGYYAAEARGTADAEVARQAARLAAYLDDPALAAEMGELWLARQPGNSEAHELLAISQIRLGNTEQAAVHIDALLASDTDQSLTALVAHARGLDQQGNEDLIRALGSLTSEYPDQAPLWYAQAIALQMDQDLAGALEATEQALKRSPEHEEALLLKARLLFETGQPDKAISHLARLQKRYPEARRVRMLHTRLLMENGQQDEAADQLEQLQEDFPAERDMAYSLALFGLDLGLHEAVRPTLSRLLDANYRPNDLHLHLGRLAEDSGRRRRAIQHYLSIEEGVNALQARVRAAGLLFEDDQPEQARALLAELRDQFPERMPSLYAAEADLLARHDRIPDALALLGHALDQFPDEYDLLYTRSMVAERAGNLDQLEVDLRRLLELNPDDPVAQNALGYTLADRTDRLEEARELIEAAYAQRPDDPAIIDSMGWVLYRLGKLDEALLYLEEAWQRYPDDEVGAHYGEVLWQLGQRDRARQIWAEALAGEPQSSKVRETLQRLTGQDTL